MKRCLEAKKLAASLCPKKVHWVVTDKGRFTKSSGIGPKCF